MALVDNWQIGRKMHYPYDDARPERQMGFVFDINRCIGCQTCTMACKSTWTFSEGQEHMWWNNVATRPYGSYPQHWDVKLLEMLGQQKWQGTEYGGRTIFETEGGELRDEPFGFIPETDEWRFPNIYEDTATGFSEQGLALPVHANFFFYLQRICNHCTYPGCLAACPRQAIYKRPEDGIVLVDQERCRGYQECLAGCPYKKTLFNSATRKTEKCIACYPRVEIGEIPRCMAACVGSIRMSGWISPPEEAREDNPIDFLVHFRKVALPLYPQFGTEPNLYYIPPRWVPRPFLLQMFGPGAQKAIEARTNPDPTLFAVLKLFGTTRRTIERFSFDGETVKGFGSEGDQVMAVPMEEPFYERPFHDVEAGVYRFNEP
ncbi:MAG: 4Fe-4S dicluster domain-containing protein [Planctomycetota bacterium]